MNAIIAEALALEAQPFDSEIARAEAFEALRERASDDDDELLFDLALIEARAHDAQRAARALAGEPADTVLTAWARVVGGVRVESRAKELTEAMRSLASALGDRTLDGSPEVASSAWGALASRALQEESEPMITAALACANRALAGVRGAHSGQCAMIMLELASHADSAAAAHDACERLWALREHEELDLDDRFQFIAPVWQVRMALGDADGARAAADALVALAREDRRSPREADALTAVAECAMAQGHVRDAREALSKRAHIAKALLEASDDDAEREFAMARHEEAIAALAKLDAMDVHGDKNQQANKNRA